MPSERLNFEVMMPATRNVMSVHDRSGRIIAWIPATSWSYGWAEQDTEPCRALHTERPPW